MLSKDSNKKYQTMRSSYLASKITANFTNQYKTLSSQRHLSNAKKEGVFLITSSSPLLSRFVKDENNLVLGHITWTLARGLENSRAKKAELERMRNLIEESQGNECF
jgi:2-phospho-L-lactate guanylyltransferase (CobY/MobA/RfbA family)